MDFENSEIPRHRKKKTKSVKKADHKHIFKPFKMNDEDLFVKIFSRSNGGDIYISYWEKCSICGRERLESGIVNEEKVKEIELDIENYKNCT